jgi:hypothetical protein
MVCQSLFTSCQRAKGNDDDVAVISTNADCLGIASDELLTEGVKFAIKDYPGVNADIEKGVITLSGSIEKHKLPELMMVLKSLRASKIVNNLSVK